MRKGDLSFTMWLVLSIMALLAIIIVVLAMRDKSINIIGILTGGS